MQSLSPVAPPVAATAAVALSAVASLRTMKCADKMPMKQTSPQEPEVADPIFSPANIASASGRKWSGAICKKDPSPCRSVWLAAAAAERSAAPSSGSG